MGDIFLCLGPLFNFEALIATIKLNSERNNRTRMCDVGLMLTGLSIATAAGTGVTSYVGQKKAANEQERYQRQLYTDQMNYRNQVAEQANKAYLGQAYQRNQKLQQEQEADAQNAQRISKEAAQARAAERVSAGEAGVAGLSIDNLLSDYYRQEDMALENLRINEEWRTKQSNEDIKGIRSEAISRANNTRLYIPQPVQKPSLLGTIFDTTSNMAVAASPLFGEKGQISMYKSKRQKPRIGP